jgi:hypothetical protein
MLKLTNADTIEAIRLVLFESYPPTNPGLLARVASEWYTEYGADAVFKQIIDRIVECSSVKHYDMENYAVARKLFLAAGYPMDAR